jgi:DnaJ-domain-containing protein 1
MFQLDDNLLRELGLGDLPPEEKNKMLAHIYETLELRVGMRLAEKMTDAQLDEFEAFIDRNDEEGALHWLEINFPNYKDVVADELNKLKDEIRAQAPAIIQATMAEIQPQSPADSSQAGAPLNPS